MPIGPGPHRSPKGMRETQKRGVVRQARKGFTVRCFWVAARDWRRRAHRQTKGGSAVSGRDQSPAFPRCQNWQLSRCSAPTSKAASTASLSASSPMLGRPIARVRCARSDPLAFHPKPQGRGHDQPKHLGRSRCRQPPTLGTEQRQRRARPCTMRIRRHRPRPPRR